MNPRFRLSEGEEVGAIVELAGGFADAVLRMRGDSLGGWGLIEDDGNRGWGELEILGDGLEADRFGSPERIIAGTSLDGAHSLPVILAAPVAFVGRECFHRTPRRIQFRELR